MISYLALLGYNLHTPHKATQIRFLVSPFPPASTVNYLIIHKLYTSIYIAIIKNFNEY